jgi:ribosome maturation factor RimP
MVCSEHLLSFKNQESFKRLFFYIWGIYYRPHGRSCKVVDYSAPEKVQYYCDCEPLVSGLGYCIVELNIFKRQTTWQVKIVIAGPENVGINDCTKVHRAILPRLEAVLDSQDMYVEVTSPGLDRILKNAAEFAVFTGKRVKVWNTDITDWIQGSVISADAVSVRLETENGPLEIPYSKIAKAKLNNA